MRQFLYVVLLSYCSVAYAANSCESTSMDWDTWLDCRLALHQTTTTTQVVNSTATTGTIESTSKATTDPSIQTNSTSLVDTTSTPDLLGFASHIAKLDSKAAGGQQDSYSFYTTAYAFYAGTQGREPLDPAFYVQNSNWRRFSLFIGREVPDDATSAPIGPGDLFGAKILFVNDRDLGKATNIHKIESIVGDLYKAGISKALLGRMLKALLGATDLDTNLNGQPFSDRITALVAGKDVPVDNLVIASLKDDSPITLERAAAQRIYDEIRKAKQLSFNFSGKKRDYATAADEYRMEGAFDSGLSSRWDLTVNGGGLPESEIHWA
jgi:hypothetical protein